MIIGSFVAQGWPLYALPGSVTHEVDFVIVRDFLRNSRLSILQINLAVINLRSLSKHGRTRVQTGCSDRCSLFRLHKFRSLSILKFPTVRDPSRTDSFNAS